jgi:hypothetical protein
MFNIINHDDLKGIYRLSKANKGAENPEHKTYTITFLKTWGEGEIEFTAQSDKEACGIADMIVDTGLLERIKPALRGEHHE